jgi:hypothetical protein
MVQNVIIKRKRSEVIMNKKIASIIYVFIIVLSLCGCGNSSNNIVEKSKKMIENDLLNSVSIYYCTYNEDSNFAYIKFHSDELGNDESLIDFSNNKIYYESVYSSIDKNDYDKIIEYGDYTTAIYQIQNNNKQWSELPIE